MKRKCQECGEKADKLYDDEGKPPIDTDACLCASCAKDRIDWEIDDLQQQIRHLENARAKIR